MSNEIRGIKITDSRINDLTNDLTFGIYDGATQSTYQQLKFDCV
jgi:hypothetical protein